MDSREEGGKKIDSKQRQMAAAVISAQNGMPAG